jgi:hypothetical protein
MADVRLTIGRPTDRRAGQPEIATGRGEMLTAATLALS